MNWIITELGIIFYICGCIVALGLSISNANGYSSIHPCISLIVLFSLLSWLIVIIRLSVGEYNRARIWFSNDMGNAPFLQYRFVERHPDGRVKYPGKY